MPLTISLETDIAKALSQLAVTACRSPQQQAKWLLTQAVLQALQSQKCPEAKGTVEADNEPALQT